MYYDTTLKNKEGNKVTIQPLLEEAGSVVNPGVNPLDPKITRR